MDDNIIKALDANLLKTKEIFYTQLYHIHDDYLYEYISHRKSLEDEGLSVPDSLIARIAQESNNKKMYVLMLKNLEH